MLDQHVPAPASVNVYPLYARDMSELDRMKDQVSGSVQQLFLINRTRDGFDWGKPCQNFNVLYHWTPSRQVHTYDLRSNDDVAAHLPFHTGLNFQAYFDQGKVVRIRVASRGAWNLDTSSLKIPRQCGVGATHYVKTIAAGAFMVTTIASAAAGGSVGIASAELARLDASEKRETGLEAGKVFECDTASDASKEPPESCREPVEIMVGPISDLPVTDDSWGVPGPGQAKPTRDTTPQPESTCYKAAAPTGNPDKDIVAMGAACKSFGLEPVGAPFVRSIASEMGWKRMFNVQLDAGACYRFIAVADEGIPNIDIGLLDAEGKTLANESEQGRVAVIDAESAFCAKKTETATIAVRAESGSGRFGFWQLKKTH